jgi:peptidyl-prolyl cis-trans isomerase NIMA-interacting 1
MRRSCLFVLATTMLVACKEPTPTPAPASSTGAQPTAVAQPATTPSAAATPSAPKAEEAPPTRIAAQHLLVAYRGAASAPRGVTRSKDDARKRAEEAAKKAKGGQDFSALVAEYSDDPTKTNQGNLGVFTREKMVKPFADAAFALPVDGVSEVVETKFGFHVIKRNQ